MKPLIPYFLLFVSFVASVIGAGLSYIDCGSVFALDDLNLNTCNEHSVERCSLWVGGNTITFNLTLEALSRNTRLLEEVYLDVWGFRFDFTATPEDPCAILPCSTLSSPNNVKPIPYRALVNVLDIPPISGDLFWKFYSEDTDDQLLCFSIPVQVMPDYLVN